MGDLAAIVVPFGPVFNVSTLTPLLASLQIKRYSRILVTLKNPDVANPVNLFVDPSTGGASFDTDKRQQARAVPGEECHVEILGGIYPIIQIQAQTDSPFPVVANVTFEVRVEHESPGALELTLRSITGAVLP